MSDNTNLGDRMKSYETSYKTTLPKRLPVIIRLDGRCFHTWTKGLERPFDSKLTRAMEEVTIDLCRNISGVKLGYTQSDEISLLVHNYYRPETEPWCANEVQKIVSLSAAYASSLMTLKTQEIFGKLKVTQFDSRVFILPENEVCNYFIWRQKDAIRNSISAFARTYFSAKELHGKNRLSLLDMIQSKGGDWKSLPEAHRWGSTITKTKPKEERTSWEVVLDAPLFSDNKSLFDILLRTEELEITPAMAG